MKRRYLFIYSPESCPLTKISNAIEIVSICVAIYFEILLDMWTFLLLHCFVMDKEGVGPWINCIDSQRILHIGTNTDVSTILVTVWNEMKNEAT